MIKSVIFDLDNTVYDYDICNQKAMEELEVYACHEFDICANEFRVIFDRARDKVKKRLGNTGASHNRMLYMQLFLEEVGKAPASLALEMYDIYWGTFLENMTLFEYVSPLIDKLRSRKIIIGVLTDLTAHIQHRKIKKLGLANQIDVLTTSEEVGVEKPDISAFSLMLSKMEINPEEALMIGDSKEKDIYGAMNAGMHTLLFERNLIPDIERIVEGLLDERMDKRKI